MTELDKQIPPQVVTKARLEQLVNDFSNKIRTNQIPNVRGFGRKTEEDLSVTIFFEDEPTPEEFTLIANTYFPEVETDYFVVGRPRAF